jgi:hypothetical protein
MLRNNHDRQSVQNTYSVYDPSQRIIDVSQRISELKDKDFNKINQDN